MSDIEWRPIPGWERYEVSSDGQVRVVGRVGYRGRLIQPRVLRPTERSGYLQIGLRGNGSRVLMTVHKAVMLAFTGPRPEGHDIRHLDGVPTNNTRANLAYGTRRQNNLDAVRHGTNSNTAKTYCKWGHEFTPENTYLFRTSRICRTCSSARRATYEAKRSAAA